MIEDIYGFIKKYTFYIKNQYSDQILQALVAVFVNRNFRKFHKCYYCMCMYVLEYLENNYNR